MGKKISLSFVNKGSPFEIPTMTVGRQEEVFKYMKEIEKKKKDISDNEMNKAVILNILQSVDSGVTMEYINNMHSSDYNYLTRHIWNDGREIKQSDEKDFPQTG